MAHRIFITGGTGYLGSRLIPLLVKRGHEVVAVARKGSEGRLPGGAARVTGDVLRMDSYTERVRKEAGAKHLLLGPISLASPAINER